MATDMATETQRLLAESLLKILRPLIRILLRNGVTYRAFTEAAKAVYIEVASAEFAIPGRKQTDSRISVITGLSRKEVKRVKSMPPATDAENLARYNRASRVISGWTQDEAFMDAHGNPADLPLDNSDNRFAELERRYSGDALSGDDLGDPELRDLNAAQAGGEEQLLGSEIEKGFDSVFPQGRP